MRKLKKIITAAALAAAMLAGAPRTAAALVQFHQTTLSKFVTYTP